ncbi:hypothetical protein CRE_15130 [Caenorhabditis remanei]|uniref:F-box domain-containing protein n=1 Tax=Caenorhabditis remanei TaxID=31234 RepID=E3NRI2_CAERE|nr:hypothetical protein CRE_15130 [Caenorhabditis remanei]
MDPPKPFPILRLPFLAIEEVFKTMHPFEIINFSMISKRTKGIAKKMGFHTKYSIYLFINETLGIRFLGTKSKVSCSYAITSNKEMDKKIEEFVSGRVIRRKVFKYSNNPIEEWKELCKYVLDIFKKQTIDVLKMFMDAFVDQNVSIIDFLKTNWKSVDECYLYQSEEENDVDEHAAYLLDNLTVKKELFFLLHHKNGDFDVKIPKNLSELYIYSSQCIGYKKLLEIDCKNVILKGNQITNEEWNMFLKKWIARETNQNLKWLNFEFRSLEEFRALVLHDIPHEVVDGAIKRTFKT